MNTYYISGLSHWSYMKDLHKSFIIDSNGMMTWPCLLIEALRKEMNDAMGIPKSRDS